MLDERVELLGHDVEQRRQLAGSPGQVLPRERPERHLADPEVGAPVEQVVDLVGALPVTVAQVSQPGLGRPAAVAVEDDRDVVGNDRLPHLMAEAVGVEPVEGREQRPRHGAASPPGDRERPRDERRGGDTLGHVFAYDTPASRKARSSRSISRAITSRCTWFVPS